MLKQIKNKIKFIRKKKYQKIILTKDFLNLRCNAYKYICNLKKNKKKCCSSNLFENKIDQKTFIVFYNKFNANLKLKEKYNTINFKKTSNKNACFCSYIFFAKLLISSSKINNLQKLNTLLKINDLLLLLFIKKKHSFFLDEFIKFINFEKKLLLKYL